MAKLYIGYIKGLFGGLLVCLLITLFAGCKAVRYVPVYISDDDSTHTETHTRIEYVKDTLWYSIPAQRAERETTDTLSELENDYAVSKAWVTPNGLLHHLLVTKAQEKPLAYDKPVEHKDSIVYRTRTVKVPYPVEKDLGWWEKARINAFWPLAAAAAVLAFVVVWLARRMKK